MLYRRAGRGPSQRLRCKPMPMRCRRALARLPGLRGSRTRLKPGMHGARQAACVGPDPRDASCNQNRSLCRPPNTQHEGTPHSHLCLGCSHRPVAAALPLLPLHPGWACLQRACSRRLVVTQVRSSIKKNQAGRVQAGKCGPGLSMALAGRGRRGRLRIKSNRAKR